jgi:hypothetical protein
MKVFVLIGRNGILKASGVIGVYKTKELAEKDAKAHEYMLDEYMISEQEIQES